MDEIYNQNSADNTNVLAIVKLCLPSQVTPCSSLCSHSEYTGCVQGLGRRHKQEEGPNWEDTLCQGLSQSAISQRGVGLGVWAWALPGHRPTQGRWWVTVSLALVWGFFSS